MRKLPVIIILLLIPIIVKSQTATATIESSSTCAGDTVMVPVNVTDFINVGAMTIFIGYDTSYAEFISIDNVNPVIPGMLTYNSSNGQIGIAYSNISGFSLANGKLFDLKYQLIANATLLTFDPGTEIANTSLEVIPLDTVNGGLYNAITLVQQPDSVQAYPDTDVTFSVLATGNNIAYQWEENSGSGWISLQNNSTYSGVQSDTLSIMDVNLSFDGNLYRCLLSSGDCAFYTSTALLEVNSTFPSATIGQVSSCPEASLLMPVFVGDFLDVVEFTFNIGYNLNVLDFVSLLNIAPELQNGTLTTEPMNNPDGITIHWVNSDPISITSGKLFDIEFQYMESNTGVGFEAGTEVINSLSNLVDITLTDGFVYQYELPVILTQPESQTVKQNEQAIFSVEATGAIAYQWQLSTDGGLNWSDLNNAVPYYNVTTAELTIDPVTWPLNGFQYACQISGEHCDNVTDGATLNVDTLTSTGNEILNTAYGMMVKPNPCIEHAYLTFESKETCSATIRLVSLNGQVYENIQSFEAAKGFNDLSIDLGSLNPGPYMIELRLSQSSGYTVQRTKLIKLLN